VLPPVINNASINTARMSHHVPCLAPTPAFLDYFFFFPHLLLKGKEKKCKSYVYSLTEIFGSEKLTGALLDRLTHHVQILEMNGDSFRLKESKSQKSKGK
jgi:hypothetical protein